MISPNPYMRPFAYQRRKSQHAIRTSSYVVIGVGVVGMLVAFAVEGAILMSASSGVVLCGCAMNSMGRQVISVRPSTLVAMTCALQFAFSNARAVASFDTPEQSSYLAYPVSKHFFTAAVIGALGGIAMWLGTRLAEGKGEGGSKSPKKNPFRITFVVPEQRARKILLQLLAGSLVVILFVPIDWLGTIGSVIELLPLLVVFLWSRLLDLKQKRGWLILYLMVGGLALHAFFFAFLRVQIVVPVMLAGLGLFSTHGLKFLRSVRLVPMAVLLLVFAGLFSILGEIRNTSTGVGRWNALTEKLGNEGDASGFTLLGRISTVSQLTQIVRLTEENGFYGGSTMEYLAYVFIPRVVWPDKPLIAKGQWFAEEIDQGRVLDSGQYSNSINMTVPGELYLNFGFSGVIAGCMIAGSLMGLVYRGVSSGGPYDLLGGAMVGYVFFVAATTGADVQVLVTFIAIYLVFVGAYYALEFLYTRRERKEARTKGRVREQVRIVRRA